MAGINDTSDDEDFVDTNGSPQARGKIGKDGKKGPTREELEDGAVAAGEEGEEGEVEVEVELEEEGEEGKDKDKDERLSANQREDSEDVRREENRRRRKEAKERQRRARARDKLELDYLRKQNDSLERRLGSMERRQAGVEVETFDSRLEQEQQRLTQADTLLGRAVANQDAENVTKLTQLRDRIRDRMQDIKTAKARHEQSLKDNGTEGSDSAEEGMDPIARANAKVFFNRHRWVDPAGRDQDSAIALAIDHAVMIEGFDPRTREYWEEVEARCKEALPHRFKKAPARTRDDDHDDDDPDDDLDAGVDDHDEDEPAPRRAAPNGKNGKNGKDHGSRGPRMANPGQGANGANGKYRLSAARRKALEENGLWDDKVLRDKYIKRFMEWDKENPPDSRGR